jgi:hypothetical protein
LTSVVAKILQSSGVDLGAYLMPAAQSNPVGHFEDMQFVDLHERLLRLISEDWRLSGQPPSFKPEWSRYLVRYIDYREKVSNQRGMSIKNSVRRKPKICRTALIF